MPARGELPTDAIDFEAPIGPPLPDPAREREPGEVAAMVFQVGILSGTLIDGQRIDQAFLNNLPLSIEDSMKLPGVRKIIDELQESLREFKSGSLNGRDAYVEAFIDAVLDQKEDPDVAQIIAIAEKIQERNALTYKVALGAVATDIYTRVNAAAIGADVDMEQ